MSIVQDFTISVFRDSPDWYAALGNPELHETAAENGNQILKLDQRESQNPPKKRANQF